MMIDIHTTKRRTWKKMFIELLKSLMTFKTTENQYVSAKPPIQVHFSIESKENVIIFTICAMVHARRPS